jgi:hypothetical protein
VVLDGLHLTDLASGEVFQAPEAFWAGAKDGAVDYGLLRGFDLARGFTLAGRVTMDWGGRRPNNSALAFQVKAMGVDPYAAVVPEPSSIALAVVGGVGACGWLGLRRRRVGAAPVEG